MVKDKKQDISRREGQILKILYRLEKATIAEIAAEMPEKIGTSSISKFLWLLEEKGLVTHARQGKRNVYKASMSPEKASKTLFEKLSNTFFQGSATLAFSALLNNEKDKLSSEEIDQLYDLIKTFKDKNDE